MPRRILLADDSVTAQNMGRKILTDAGYEVITVNNGSAALKKIGEAKPDLIVLDVYMPGYSGLEVCFRLKETHDTADIPVLLTVGKLEPFKQDEARRARADAFIIKPFEASELLAALSKLEATALTKSHVSGNPGQPVKDMATFERFATESGPRYGDEESGWKARLKFPGAAQRSANDAEPEAPPASSDASFRQREATDSTSSQPHASPPAMERPIPAGIPQDITPEEIAALSAAAARVGMGFNGREFEPLKVSTAPAPAAVSEEDEGEAEKSRTPISEAEAEKAQSPKAIEAASTIDITEAPAAQASEYPEKGVAPVGPAPEALPAATHSEVEAAWRSLAASTASALIADSPATPVVPAPEEKVAEPVTIAAAVADAAMATRVAGARWIAEEIPVEAPEAALALEKEMQKAFAAFAAAEYKAGAYDPAPVDREDEPMFATMAPPAIGSPVPLAEVQAVEPESRETQAASMAASASAGATYTAGTEGKGVDEPSRPPAPLAPAATMLDEDKHAVAAFGAPHPFGVTETPVPEARMAVTAESQNLEPVKTVEEHQPPAMPEEKRRESEMAAAAAAAWANWRDMRGSVVGEEQKNGAPSEPVPASSTTTAKGGFEDFTPLRPAEGPPSVIDEPEMAADDADAVSADSLSNIVDGMLAELKPKLMAELAKKLDNEKKKKR